MDHSNFYHGFQTHSLLFDSRGPFKCIDDQKLSNACKIFEGKIEAGLTSKTFDDVSTSGLMEANTAYMFRMFVVTDFGFGKVRLGYQ